MECVVDFSQLNVWDMVFSVLTVRGVEAPLAREFEQQHPQKRGRWWDAQREHMLHYFGHRACRDSGAALVRDIWSQKNLKSLGWIAGQIWIAEAVHVDAALVREAIANIQNIDCEKTRDLTAFRRMLSWDAIAHAIETNPKNHAFRKELTANWSKHHSAAG